MTQIAPKLEKSASPYGIFTDKQKVSRQDDLLTSRYSVSEVMRRIWVEHLLPRRRYLVIAGIAMIISAGTTGLVPIIIQQVADEIFIRGNQNLVYLLTVADIRAVGPNI